MKAIGKEMKKAESDLSHLTLRELFRRDYKNALDNGAEECVLPIAYRLTDRPACCISACRTSR